MFAPGAIRATYRMFGPHFLILHLEFEQVSDVLHLGLQLLNYTLYVRTPDKQCEFLNGWSFGMGVNVDVYVLGKLPR